MGSSMGIAKSGASENARISQEITDTVRIRHQARSNSSGIEFSEELRVLCSPAPKEPNAFGAIYSHTVAWIKWILKSAIKSYEKWRSL